VKAPSTLTLPAQSKWPRECEKCQRKARAEDGGGEPEEEDGEGGGAAGADEAMGEVVLVADVEGFAESPADVNDGDEVGEDDAEDEQGFEDARDGMLKAVWKWGRMARSARR
jgi:hypothetical protein